MTNKYYHGFTNTLKDKSDTCTTDTETVCFLFGNIIFSIWFTCMPEREQYIFWYIRGTSCSQSKLWHSFFGAFHMSSTTTVYLPKKHFSRVFSGFVYIISHNIEECYSTAICLHVVVYPLIWHTVTSVFFFIKVHFIWRETESWHGEIQRINWVLFCVTYIQTQLKFICR